MTLLDLVSTATLSVMLSVVQCHSRVTELCVALLTDIDCDLDTGTRGWTGHTMVTLGAVTEPEPVSTGAKLNTDDEDEMPT